MKTAKKRSVRSWGRGLAILLILVMTFSLAGCGDSDDTSSDRKERRTEKSSTFGDKLSELAGKTTEEDTTDLQPQDGGDYSALTTEESTEATTEDTAGETDTQMDPLTSSIPSIYSEEEHIM